MIGGTNRHADTDTQADGLTQRHAVEETARKTDAQ